MNLNDLGLHEALLHALETREPDAPYLFLSKILDHVNRRKENVSAQVRIGSGRELLYLVPLFEWLLSERPDGRGLVVLPSDQDVAAAAGRGAALAESLGMPVHPLGRDPDSSDSTARLVLGAAEVLSFRHEEGSFDLGGFGFVVVDGLSRFAESPLSGTLRRINARLRPPRERRTVLFAARLDIKEQTLALELADGPAELYLEEEAERTKHLPQTTWYVSVENKIRLLLGVLKSDARGPVAVFCNLPETAQEVARRLGANGRRGECVIESIPAARAEALLARARTGELGAVVFTDEGARGLPRGSCRLVINYDIPLEGEPYLERIRFLDPSAPDARILNFACDRYVYGIPAVEQFMGISLGAVQVDESLLAPEDRSAGAGPNRGGSPRENRNGWKGDRPRERGREDRPVREGGPDRSPDRRDPSRRPRSEGGFPRDGRNRDRDGDLRNQESIRAGIAELTGVNLGGSGARNRPPESPESPGSQGRGGPDHVPRPEGPGRGTRRNKRGRKGPPGGDAPRSGNPVSRASFPDPYALPMEERMRLYKEKYGKRLAENPEPKAPGREKGRKRRGRHPGASRSGPAPGSDSGGAPSSTTDPVRSAAPEPSSPAGGENRGGLFGRLFSAPRKDDREGLES